MSRMNSIILRLRVPAVAVAIAVAFAGSNRARAIDIRVDFNNRTTTPSNWNLVSSPTVGSGVDNLIDFGTGLGTGVSIVIHDDFEGSSGVDNPWSDSPAYRAWIDLDANKDYFLLRVLSSLTGGVTFSGLDPTKTYRVELLGSREDPTSRNFRAQVNDLFSDNSNSTLFNASTQGFTGHQVMTWRQVTAPNGEIVVSLDTPNQHAYINALRLTEAPPQTVLIDFGADSLTTPGRWNNITGTTTGGLMALGHKLIGAVDAAGQETNVRVNFLSGFNGGTNTAGLPSDAAGFAITAQRDSILIENKVPPAVVQLEGLTPGAAYDVTLFGSRAQHLESERGARFTIGGVSQDLLNTDNESNAVRFDNVVANQHGHIQIDVGVYVGQWAYLGGLEINGQFRPKVHRPSLFFDFGSPSYQTPGHWNNITTIDEGLKISDAVNSIGESTGVSLTFANAFNSIGAGSTEATGGSWSDDAGFPISAQRDTFLVNDTVRQMQLDGLIPGAEYEVRLFGSRHDANYARTTDFRVGTASGDWSDWITLDTAFNTENVVQFITRPDALGGLLVEARRAPGGAWGYLGVMQITQIPEPGSAALLLAGAFCLMLRRRRRRRGG